MPPASGYLRDTGCIAGAVGYGYLNQNHKMAAKNVGKALHNVSRFVDNVGSMF